MKKSSLILLALCAGAPLMAQAPSLTFYGVLDTGVASVAHSSDNSDTFAPGTYPFPQKSNKSVLGMYNGGLSGTRVGVKGSTDLGDGWKALFTLENGFNLPTGRVSDAAIANAQNSPAVNNNTPPVLGAPQNQGHQLVGDSSKMGQLFSRGAFVGVSHPTYGTLTLGRQQALMTDALPAYDANGMPQLFSPIGFTGTYAGGGLTEDAVVDSAIKYRVKVADVTIAALYKVSGVAGSTSAKGSQQVTIAYEPGAFGIIAGYEAYKDAFAMAPGASLGLVNLTAQDTKAVFLSARYKIGPVLITAGYQDLKYSNPSDPINCAATQNLYGQLVGTVAVTPYTIAGVEVDKEVKLMYAGAAWDVTSHFTVGVSYYLVKQNDYSQGTYNPVTFNNSKGEGKSKYASLVATYKFTKALDLYFGYMNSKNTDALASGLMKVSATTDDLSSNSITGLGIRYKF